MCRRPMQPLAASGGRRQAAFACSRPAEVRAVAPRGRPCTHCSERREGEWLHVPVPCRVQARVDLREGGPPWAPPGVCTLWFLHARRLFSFFSGSLRKSRRNALGGRGPRHAGVVRHPSRARAVHTHRRLAAVGALLPPVHDLAVRHPHRHQRGDRRPRGGLPHVAHPRAVEPCDPLHVLFCHRGSPDGECLPVRFSSAQPHPCCVLRPPQALFFTLAHARARASTKSSCAGSRPTSIRRLSS